MKNTLKITTMLVLIVLLISGCNKDLFDTNYTYDIAIVKMPDGSVTEIAIKQWTDYGGEQLQIIATDGTIYLVNSVNCVLINK